MVQSWQCGRPTSSPGGAKYTKRLRGHQSINAWKKIDEAVIKAVHNPCHCGSKDYVRQSHTSESSAYTPHGCVQV